MTGVPKFHIQGKTTSAVIITNHIPH